MRLARLWATAGAAGAATIGGAFRDDQQPRLNFGDPELTMSNATCRPSALYNRTVDPSRYQFGCLEIEEMLAGPMNKIAHGHSRKVYLVEYQGVRLVLKKTKHQSAKALRRDHVEAVALDLVPGAPYIAPTLGFCGTTSVQPYFSGGTVEEHIGNAAWTGEPIDMATVLQMSLDSTRGLATLHEAPGGPIIHNAMRPEQLLVYGNGTVVVSDLNSCGFLGVEEGTGKPCPAHSDTHHNIRWDAPEHKSTEGFNEKVDIYSMGIIFWQLMSLQTIPFEGLEKSDAKESIKNGKRPHIDDAWDSGYAQLLQDMWATDPEARPSAREVVGRLEGMLMLG